MQATYGGQQPDFEFQRQVDKMLALQRENPGRILTLGAFDPFRRAQALPYAKDQHAKGVAGFKFYPPSGYRPAKNDIPPMDRPRAVKEHWNSRYLNLADSDLNRINMEFFDWCADNDIPIFVHCTPEGFEATKGYGLLMCDPVYWKTVLAKHHNLRVCFGHAGGSGLYLGYPPKGSDYHEVSAAYGEAIAKLCEQYPNVYCEAGYWQELLEDSARDKVQAKLRELFRTYPKLKHRLVYGTDWFMLAQEKKHRAYLSQMAVAFEHPDLQAAAPYFFAANFARFLKLDALATDPRLDPAQHSEFAKLITQLPPDWKSP
jgi:predicted TIM-barrel fold metal-dependent hydrolase